MKTPEELLNDFLKENSLVIVPEQPNIQYTHDGGAIFTPRVSIKRIDKKE